jgi:hypothetical protein
MKAIIKYFAYALFTAFQFTAVNGENPLVGEYSANQKFAEIKIEKSLTGKYMLFTKDSKDADWKKNSELRPANDEELHQTFGDRWNRVETSLVLQDGLIPRLGFYHIKAGQFGRDLILKPTCLFFTPEKGLMEIKKFDLAEAAIIEQDKNNKESQIKARSQKVNALLTATPSDLSPYGKNSLQDWNLHAGEFVEWRLNVRDVQRAPNNPNTYLLKTGHDWEIPCEVELFSNTESLNKVIEEISPNTSIAIRGQIVGIENSHLLIGPAIIRSEHLNSTLIAKIENLSKMTENGLDLSEIQADLKPDSKRTTIQQENITRRLNTLKGSLVQGTFTNYSAEPTSSGCVLVQYDGQSFKQRDDPDCILIFSPIKSKESMEQVLPIIMSGKPIKFRGYIAEAKSGMIQIDPAILLPSTTVSRTEADQSSVMDSPATVAESDTKLGGPMNEDGEIFVTAITKNDVHNSKGIRITDPVLILMQDRANVHRFGNPDDDVVDRFFSLAENRSRIRTYLSRGNFPNDVRTAMANGDGRNFRVRIYKNNEDKYCVDVSFSNNANPENSKGAANAGNEMNLDRVIVYELIDSESNIREGPGTNFPIIRKSEKGEQGQVVDEKSPWIQLRFVDRSHGWVHKQNIRLSAKP